jgi:hypothetical protein
MGTVGTPPSATVSLYAWGGHLRLPPAAARDQPDFWVKSPDFWARSSDVRTLPEEEVEADETLPSPAFSCLAGGCFPPVWLGSGLGLGHDDQRGRCHFQNGSQSLVGCDGWVGGLNSRAAVVAQDQLDFRVRLPDLWAKLLDFRTLSFHFGLLDNVMKHFVVKLASNIK